MSEENRTDEHSDGEDHTRDSSGKVIIPDEARANASTAASETDSDVQEGDRELST